MNFRYTIRGAGSRHQYASGTVFSEGCVSFRAKVDSRGETCTELEVVM